MSKKPTQPFSCSPEEKVGYASRAADRLRKNFGIAHTP